MFAFTFLIDYWVEIGVVVALGILILVFKRLKYHCTIPSRLHFIDNSSDLELNRELDLHWENIRDNNNV